MATQCTHIKSNGEICHCDAVGDSQFCYWHHKARVRRRNHLKEASRSASAGDSGITLPLLEDANAIQIALQEVMQAILDRRIDNKRAGLLLYALQIASSNLLRIDLAPDEDECLASPVDNEEIVFNDAVDGNPCMSDCARCDEDDCDDRREDYIPPPKEPPKKPPSSESAPNQSSVKPPAKGAKATGAKAPSA